MQEKRVLFTRTHPRKHAQEAIFPVIYSFFWTFPTPILTPKSLQITVPPPGGGGTDLQILGFQMGVEKVQKTL